MAAYDNEFSFVLPITTDEQREWASRLIGAIRMWDDGVPNGPLAAAFGDEFDYIGVELSLEADRLCVQAGRTGDVAHAISLTQHYLTMFRPTGSVGIEWANTCSAPRSDGFGGGAARVTATDVHAIDTATWLAARSGTVTVLYTIPLNIDVDLGSGEVVRVTVLDELLNHDEALGVYDHAGNPIEDIDVRELAVAIVNNDELCWPSWQFGY